MFFQYRNIYTENGKSLSPFRVPRQSCYHSFTTQGSQKFSFMISNLKINSFHTAVLFFKLCPASSCNNGHHAKGSRK